MAFEIKERYTVADLKELVALLRAPDGCPWDSVQTHQSIRRNFIEETLEACEAIDRDDPVLMREELGDVLMQVIFHAGIEEDAGRFTLDDAADTACKKLVFRHPNLFPPEEGTVSQSLSWDELKRREKGQETYADTLDSVARTLPGLWRAEKLQKKAAKAGFVWPDAAAAADKLAEETGELRLAVREGSNIAEELGDTLFAAVGVALQFGLDPETLMTNACEKYITRFRRMEENASAAGTPLDTLNVDEQMAHWVAAKLQLREEQQNQPEESHHE